MTYGLALCDRGAKGITGAIGLGRGALAITRVECAPGFGDCVCNFRRFV